MAAVMDKAKRLFQNYVNAAADLAESVKRNIIKDGIVDDTTVNKLNDFMIATNALAEYEENELELDEEPNNEENESDPSLN